MRTQFTKGSALHQEHVLKNLLRHHKAAIDYAHEGLNSIDASDPEEAGAVQAIKDFISHMEGMTMHAAKSLRAVRKELGDVRASGYFTKEEDAEIEGLLEQYTPGSDNGSFEDMGFSRGETLGDKYNGGKRNGPI